MAIVALQSERDYSRPALVCHRRLLDGWLYSFWGTSSRCEALPGTDGPVLYLRFSTVYPYVIHRYIGSEAHGIMILSQTGGRWVKADSDVAFEARLAQTPLAHLVKSDTTHRTQRLAKGHEHLAQRDAAQIIKHDLVYRIRCVRRVVARCIMQHAANEVAGRGTPT